MTLTKQRLAVIVLVALLVALALAVLLVASTSWAAMYEWMTTTPPCEGPCD
jgi:hypothetical protein